MNAIIESRKSGFDIKMIDKFIERSINTSTLFYRMCWKKPFWFERLTDGDKWYGEYFSCNEFDFRHIVLPELRARGADIDERLGWVYISFN